VIPLRTTLTIRAKTRKEDPRGADMVGARLREWRSKDREKEGGGVMRASVAMLGLICGIVPALAADDEVEAFYRGKQIHLIVGSGVGSGYDINARAVARYLGGHIPGNPTIVVQNQPGAGSLITVNALANTAARDGTVIAAVINGVPTAPLLQPDAARFDPLKLNWIGSTNRDTQVVYAWHSAPVVELRDLLSKELIIGATSSGTTQVDFPVVANAILGTKFKVVSGYEGTAQIHKAMEAGEVQGLGSLAWSSLKALNADWIASGKIRILAQWSAPAHPDLMAYPLVESLAKSDDDRLALKLLTSRLEAGRPFAAPPGVPPARIAALRKAFDETMRDPAFLNDAKRLLLDVEPMSGQEVADLVRSVLATPPAVVARVRGALDGK
jgi:hypothetical protein